MKNARNILIQKINSVLKSEESKLCDEDVQVLNSIKKELRKPNLKKEKMSELCWQLIKVLIGVGIEVLIHKYNE